MRKAPSPSAQMAWANRIFMGSTLAALGGPIRRSLSSIERYSSLAIVLIAARHHGWIARRLGSQVLFYSAWTADTVLVDGDGTVAFPA